MSGLVRLARGNSCCDHDIAQIASLVWPATPKPRGGGGKREDVGGLVFPAVLTIERADARIGNDRDGHRPARTRRSDGGEPGRKLWRAQAAWFHNSDHQRPT